MPIALCVGRIPVRGASRYRCRLTAGEGLLQPSAGCACRNSSGFSRGLCRFTCLGTQTVHCNLWFESCLPSQPPRRLRSVESFGLTASSLGWMFAAFCLARSGFDQQRRASEGSHRVLDRISLGGHSVVEKSSTLQSLDRILGAQRAPADNITRVFGLATSSLSRPSAAFFF